MTGSTETGIHRTTKEQNNARQSNYDRLKIYLDFDSLQLEPTARDYLEELLTLIEIDEDQLDEDQGIFVLLGELCTVPVDHVRDGFFVAN